MAYLTQYSSSVPVIKHNIEQTYMTIGQNMEMDICVVEDGVAESHATVEAVKFSEVYRFTVQSQENESPLELNGDTVSQAELQDGDWLVIGGVEFQFTDDGIDPVSEVIPTITETTPQAPSLQAESAVNIEVESDALQLMKDLKEEVESISTKDFIEDSRFSRRIQRI